MTANVTAAAPRGTFLQGLAVQARVIAALMLRELHTRYGRENIGYMWLIAEPLMLATIIGSLHAGHHTEYGSDMKPISFAVLGYTVFIMFRGIVNRSEGGLESNAALLYHRMVTIFDIVTARALLETAGILLALATLTLILTFLGLGNLPERPLYLFAAIALMFWYAFGHSLIITAITHENRTIGRLVHPYSYFMIPLSGAFYQVEWVPHPYRDYLVWFPLPHIFELARYGQFRAANLTYFSGQYIVGACLILTWIGLICLKLVRSKVHLS
jgi:capsular polysaccharide transport system permease protein